MTIYKYLIETSGRQTIGMPQLAEILCVQIQYGAPVLWALADPDQPNADRTIETFGTGHAVPATGRRRYIGTYQRNGGALVNHVFEVLA